MRRLSLFFVRLRRGSAPDNPQKLLDKENGFVSNTLRKLTPRYL